MTVRSFKIRMQTSSKVNMNSTDRYEAATVVDVDGS